jgi:hypothetical protein
MKIRIEIFNGSNSVQEEERELTKFDRIAVAAMLAAPMYSIWEPEAVLAQLLRISPTVFVLDARQWGFIGLTHAIISRDGQDDIRGSCVDDTRRQVDAGVVG